MKGEVIYHSLHRKLKHISVMVCIPAAAERMMPFFVSSQAHEAVHRQLQVDGFRLGTDLTFKHRDKPHMNAQLFAEYISIVFIPYVEELRSLEEFAGREVVLLMDNCSVHRKLETLQVLAEHRVKVIPFPPQAMRMFQALDLSLFGIFKKKMNYQLPVRNDKTTVGFIKRIFHNLKQSRVEDNVRSAFMYLGLTYQVDTTLYLLIFDENVPRESQDFQTLWQRDYPIEALSPRRRTAAFGWINEQTAAHWNAEERV
jgi:hypothetical protein